MLWGPKSGACEDQAGVVRTRADRIRSVLRRMPRPVPGISDRGDFVRRPVKHPKVVRGFMQRPAWLEFHDHKGKEAGGGCLTTVPFREPGRTPHWRGRSAQGDVMECSASAIRTTGTGGEFTGRKKSAKAWDIDR